MRSKSKSKSKQLKATVVFQYNWEAIHELCPTCKGQGDKNCEWCEGSHRKYKYIINEGSSRSSKTYSLIDCFDMYARANANKRGTIWRESKIDCKRTVLKDIIKHHRDTGRYKVDYTFNKTESEFIYSNDTSVEIHGADEEDKVHGLTQDFSWLNEPYGISLEVFNQIDQRTSDFVIIDWNPRMDHFIDDLKKDRRAILIKSTFKMNPFCPPAQRAKILGYQPIGRCYIVESGLLSEEQAFVYDCSENVSGFDEKNARELARCQRNHEKNSANDFNWSVYGLGEKGERPNRIFRWAKIKDVDYKNIDATKFYGVDWGVVDPWGILEIKYYDGNLYLHELNYDSENKVMEKMSIPQIEEIRRSDEGIVAWMFERLGINKSNVVVCDNNRPEKIKALRRSGWEYAIRAAKGSGSILEGIDLLSKINVFYTESSTNISYEQENYSRKVDRYGIVLEEPEDKDNHTIDPTRYVADYLRREGIIKVI